MPIPNIHSDGDATPECLSDLIYISSPHQWFDLKTGLPLHECVE